MSEPGLALRSRAPERPCSQSLAWLTGQAGLGENSSGRKQRWRLWKFLRFPVKCLPVAHASNRKAFAEETGCTSYQVAGLAHESLCHCWAQLIFGCSGKKKEGETN